MFVARICCGNTLEIRTGVTVSVERHTVIREQFSTIGGTHLHVFLFSRSTFMASELLEWSWSFEGTHVGQLVVVVLMAE